MAEITITANDKSEAFSTINRIYFRIQAGEKFDELAKMYSNGPNAEKGGDLGYKDRSFVESYLAKAEDYTLTAGKVTPILETPTGYVLLYPEDIVPAKDVSLEDARGEVKNLILERQKAKNFQEWLNIQTRKSKLEVVDDELYKLVSVAD